MQNDEIKPETTQDVVYKLRKLAKQRYDYKQTMRGYTRYILDHLENYDVEAIAKGVVCLGPKHEQIVEAFLFKAIDLSTNFRKTLEIVNIYAIASRFYPDKLVKIYNKAVEKT